MVLYYIAVLTENAEPTITRASFSSLFHVYSPHMGSAGKHWPCNASLHETQLSDHSDASLPINDVLTFVSRNTRLAQTTMPSLHRESMTLVRRRLVRKPGLSVRTTEMIM